MTNMRDTLAALGSPCPSLWASFLLTLIQAGVSQAGSTCSYAGRAGTLYVYCEYGCCGTEKDRECCPYTVSTSVLIVSGIVGGLVVVALIVAFIICCIKSYKDKQNNRVRSLQQTDTHRAEHTRRVPATVPKPPEYTEAPPPYSYTMPTSHYRPPTVTGNYNFNTRYHHHQTRTTERPSAVTESNVTSQPNGISHTHTSGMHPSDSTSRHRNVYPPSSSEQANVYPPPSTSLPQPDRGYPPTSHGPAQTNVPGAISDPPPAYSEFQRGLTPRPNQ